MAVALHSSGESTNVTTLDLSSVPTSAFILIAYADDAVAENISTTMGAPWDNIHFWSSPRTTGLTGGFFAGTDPSWTGSLNVGWGAFTGVDTGTPWTSSDDLMAEETVNWPSHTADRVMTANDWWVVTAHDHNGQGTNWSTPPSGYTLIEGQDHANGSTHLSYKVGAGSATENPGTAMGNVSRCGIVTLALYAAPVGNVTMVTV